MTGAVLVPVGGALVVVAGVVLAEVGAWVAVAGVVLVSLCPWELSVGVDALELVPVVSELWAPLWPGAFPEFPGAEGVGVVPVVTGVALAAVGVWVSCDGADFPDAVEELAVSLDVDDCATLPPLFCPAAFPGFEVVSELVAGACSAMGAGAGGAEGCP